MIDIKEKSNCCGCEACVNICPQKCITMQEDDEGFRYPVVDKEKCIECGLCENTCPILKKCENKDLLNKTEFLAAYNKDDYILKNSSSGGIFWIIAQYFFEHKGIVYGVIQENTYSVKFIRATNVTEAEKIRGSKYLQAKINNIYIKVKNDLEDDKLVLFSGTPCQIAALYKFLKKDYLNLFTIDVVCHGVPSNKVYKKYIDYVEKNKKHKVTNIKWRDKKDGKWGPNKITLYFDDGSTSTTISRENPFQVGFLENLYLRPSCYTCKYAALPRIADISLADFWGYDKEFLEKNNNKGISIVIISTIKAKDLINKLKDKMNIHSVEEEYVKSKSRHVYIHPLENSKREEFFKDLDIISFKKISKKYKMRNVEIVKFLKKVKRKILK